MKKLRRGGVVSGVVSCTGDKIKPYKPLREYKPKAKRAPSQVHIVEVEQITQPSPPKGPLTQDQVKEAVLGAYDRHLKRAAGNKAAALDMTYFFLKHMRYIQSDWEDMVKILVVMKGQLDGKQSTSF